MAYKKIFIVGGHGKNGNRIDNGAVAIDGTTEREIIEAVSREVKNLVDRFGLSNLFEFVGVLDRKTIPQKVDFVNGICSKESLTWRNSLLLSLHCDWRGAREGVGAFHYNDDFNSALLANSVADSVALVGDRKKIWVKEERESNYSTLGIIHNSDPLAALLEIGSLRADENDEDGLELLKSEKGKRGIARAIFNSLLVFAGHNIPEDAKKTLTTQNKVSLLAKKSSQMATAAKVINKDPGKEKNLENAISELKKVF